MVQFKRIRSSKQKIARGVPQGSIIGPILFIICADDLTVIVKSNSIKIITDDTILVKLAISNAVLLAKSKASVREATIWFASNELTINIERKCKS